MSTFNNYENIGHRTVILFEWVSGGMAEGAEATKTLAEATAAAAAAP